MSTPEIRRCGRSPQTLSQGPVQPRRQRSGRRRSRARLRRRAAEMLRFPLRRQR